MYAFLGLPYLCEIWKLICLIPQGLIYFFFSLGVKKASSKALISSVLWYDQLMDWQQTKYELQALRLLVTIGI